MTAWLRRSAMLLLLVSLARFAAADESPLSLPDYKARLELYNAQIQKVVEHHEYAVEFYRELPSELQVLTPSRTMTVSLAFLRNGLESFLKSSPTVKANILEQLGARVKAMRAEADRFEQANPGDAAARERLNRIMSAREFGRLRGPTELELLWERISDWLDKKLSKLFPSESDLDQFGQVLVWIVIGIVSAILATWLYRRSRERLMDRPREVMPFVPSARSWRAWMAEAREKASLGQWRDAIHLGFWAAVARLESDGLWPPDKARTPREYLNAIPVSDTRSSFAAVTKTFESIWYGGRPAAARDFESFTAELEKLGCRG